MFGIKLGQSLVAKRIVSHRTHRASVETKLCGMISEVGRGTAQFAALGQAIPKSLAQSYNKVFFHVIIVL